ncbi:DNA-binding domain-containing protein, KilA-N-like [Desulfonema limicola]|uniref:DNA-binding domain-containing protein, KilA-N-like n=1 Tax=Desulfonema limicola TaxID=45656 RepID=A0A975GJU5_9BACT|nr:ORF6N domain-containing protein [Desulfonema limicola]QTA83877.1 DNA-binding domain-containing protein, KilA-N-like [Desulfonema limicola]
MKENKALVTVMGKEIEQVEYKGMPVVTLRMMDELHERPEGTARNAFFRHKDKLIEGEDYFEVPFEEWSQIIAVKIFNGDPDENSENNLKQRNPIKFLTVSGYLMLVKSFTDDLAWKVQRELVKNYFTTRANYSQVRGKLLEEQAKQMEREIRWLNSKRKAERMAEKEAIRILKGKSRIEDYADTPELQRKISTTLENNKDILKYSIPQNLDRWWYECLLSGKNSNDGYWKRDIPVQELIAYYNAFVDQLRAKGYRHINVDFGRALRKLCKGIQTYRPSSPGPRPRWYKLPSLDECRDQYQKLINININWDKEI